MQDVQPKQDDGGRPARETLLKPFSFDGWGYNMPPLDLAERQAQMEDYRAELTEKGPFPDDSTAKEHREMAAWWRSLADCPEEKAQPDYLECETDARDAINALLVRAENNEGPLVGLFSIALDLLGGLHALAANGNKTAAAVWANTLANSIEDFNMLAFHKQEIIEELARGSFAIPGMISQNKEKTASNAKLVKRLQVGVECDVAIVSKGKRGWKVHGTANGLAMKLKSYIELARTHYGIHELQAQMDGRELPAWLHDAIKLEPFGAKAWKAWKAWADIAWRVLAEISPNGKPGQHSAFYEPATKICTPRKTRTNPYYRNNENAPSIAENDIKEALFDAFKLIATGTSRRTARRRKAGKPA